jgi:hypothetical protein
MASEALLDSILLGSIPAFAVRRTGDFPSGCSPKVTKVTESGAFGVTISDVPARVSVRWIGRSLIAEDKP